MPATRKKQASQSQETKAGTRPLPPRKAAAPSMRRSCPSTCATACPSGQATTEPRALGPGNRSAPKSRVSHLGTHLSASTLGTCGLRPSSDSLTAASRSEKALCTWRALLHASRFCFPCSLQHLPLSLRRLRQDVPADNITINVAPHCAASAPMLRLCVDKPCKMLISPVPGIVADWIFIRTTALLLSLVEGIPPSAPHWTPHIYTDTDSLALFQPSPCEFRARTIPGKRVPRDFFSEA